MRKIRDRVKGHSTGGEGYFQAIFFYSLAFPSSMFGNEYLEC